MDALQAPVPGAAVFLVSAQGAVLGTSRSGDDGSFEVAVPAVGSHRLRISARGFESVEALLDRTRLGSLQIVLAPARVSTEVTVTASRGLIEEPGRSPHVVTVRHSPYLPRIASGAMLGYYPVGNNPHGLCVWPQPGRYSLGHTGNLR